jgi:hypothetical protein
MAGWKELLLDILKLTEETKRLNETVGRLERHVLEVDKRVVRLETLVEVAKIQHRLPDE